MIDLHGKMLDAHAANDVDVLVSLYTQAANEATDVDAECFYLTHAFVFALEAGDPRAGILRARLVKHGREEAD